jgi:glyoxylase-like metal-dependent hydrolase (beta-lactamase superfamily II)
MNHPKDTALIAAFRNVETTVNLSGHTPGHTGYEFSSKGQKVLFWGDIVPALRVQLQHPEVTAVFDIDQTAAALSPQE